MRVKKIAMLLIAALMLFLPLLVDAKSPTVNVWGPKQTHMWRAQQYGRALGFQIAFGGITGAGCTTDDIYIVAYDWNEDGSADATVGQFEQLGIDDYIGGGDFFLRVCMTADSAAPLYEERQIVGFDSDEGLIVVSPAFSAAVGEDEYVMVMHNKFRPKRYLSVTVDHVKADSVWSSVASHEVFDVTGQIEFWLMVYDSIAIQGADSILFRIGANLIFAVLKNDWDAGEILNLGNTPANYVAGNYTIYNPAASSTNSGVIADGTTGAVMFHGYSNAIDIGYEVQTATIKTTGISRWLLWFDPIDDLTGDVVAGDGGTL